MIILMPIAQLVILVFAANFEMKNILLGIVDRDHSSISRKMIDKLQASRYFKLKDFTTSSKVAMRNLALDKTDLIIEIPRDFEKDVQNGNTPHIAITVNSINSMKAGLAASYAGNILGDFAQELSFNYSLGYANSDQIDITWSNWFNPLMDYKSLMLPGILAILITIMGILLTALNIVREKEMGTIEQINVTPIGKIQFLVGKLFPFWVVGLFQLTLGLCVSVFIYHLEIQGSIILLYGVVAIYLVAILGLGFLISTISDTQTQAMFVTLFFMIMFILLCGLFTPIESMPQWAQDIDLINPVAYLVSVIRLVILKGSTLSDIKPQITAIITIGLCVNALVFWRYRKVS
jgi:ABC-2 type transport system permease protein